MSTAKEMADNSLRVSQSYFSALARGGLTAALSYNGPSSQSIAQCLSQYRQSPSSAVNQSSKQSSNAKSTHSPQNSFRQGFQEITNYSQNSQKGTTRRTSASRDRKGNSKGCDENGRKINKQLFPPSAASNNVNEQKQQHIMQKVFNDGDFRHQKKVMSLMSGNDLQPLEEEVSKEEDESVMFNCHPYGNQQFQQQSTSHQTQSQSRVSNHSQYQHQIPSQHQQFVVGQGTMANIGSNQSLLRGMQNSSSYVSGDYNYNMNMEEAQLYEFIRLQEDENASAKIFDPQFQQSYETGGNYSYNNQKSASQNISNTNNQSSNQSRGSSGIVDYNQQQKDKARQIIEQMRQQHKSKSPSNNQPVEQRLFDYQKKIEEKLELQRKQKELYEIQQLRQVPQISGKTNEILLRKSMQLPSSGGSGIQQQISPRDNSHSPNSRQCMFNLTQHNPLNGTQTLCFSQYMVEPRAYYEELKRKEDLRQKILEEKEMQGFTGKPQINKKSQMIKRKVDDLMEWKELQEKKREGELQKKIQMEVAQIQQLQSHRVVSKQSEKLVEQRFRRGEERVEDRLLRDASHRQKKQQNQVFSASEIGKSTKRMRSKSANGNKSQNREPSPNYARGRSKDQQQQMRRGMVQSVERQVQNATSPIPSESSGMVIKQSVLSPLSQSQNSENQVQLQNLREQVITDQLLPYPQMLPQQVPINQYQANQFQIQPMHAQQAHLDTHQYYMNINQSYLPHSQFDMNPQTPQYSNIPTPLHQNLQYTPQNLTPQYFQPQYYQVQSLSNDKNQNAIKPYNQLSSQIKSQSANTQGKKKGYESLFEKLSRMNTSNNNSCDQESSRSSQMPIVSAHNPQILYQNVMASPMVGQTQTSMCHSDNPIYQSIQQDSKRMSEKQYHQLMMIQDPQHMMTLQSQHQMMQTFQNQQLQQQMTMDPRSMMNQYPPMDLIQQQQLYFQTLDNQQMNRLTAPMSRNLNINQILQAQTTSQEQIIHKILENSFIPSGNVNQTRKSQREYDSEQEVSGGGTFGLQNPGFDGNQLYQPTDFDGCVLSNEKLQFNTESVFSTRTRNQNDGQILDTEFITNTSRASDFNVVRNLTQILSQEGKINNQEQIISPRTGQAQNFMDRNAQWLENKKLKIEKAREISEQRQERECPFKPQIKNHQVQVDKQSVGNKSSRSKSQKSKSSLSVESRQHLHSQSQTSNHQDSQRSKASILVEKEIQVNSDTLSPPRESLIQSNKPITVKDLSVQTSDKKVTSNYQAFQNCKMMGQGIQMKGGVFQYSALDELQQNLSSINPVSQTSSSNYDSLPRSDLMQGTQKKIISIQDLDMSGQCDVSNLSPERPNQSNIEEDSMMSLGAGELDTVEKQHMGSKAFVKMVINKKPMNF